MPRLFAGLEIPAEIGQQLSNLRGGLPGARWIDPENYHVTLRFIGDIDGMSANEIASLLFRINRKPFEVKVQGLQSFGGKKMCIRDRSSLGLKGDEKVTIRGLQGDLKPRQTLTAEIVSGDGSLRRVPLLGRIDTLDELEYYRNGGILQYVLRNLAA